MERTIYTIPKRLIAMMLSVVMVISLMPVVDIFAAGTLPTTGKVADASTMDDWKNFFSSTNINTEHAGGIWTDKSVFTDASAFSGITMKDSANFLVALSALAGNSIVVGKDSAPTDTTFILDVSNSMDSSELSSLITAVNNAIHTLMTINEKNRVGVVLYATTVQELMPMDHYTPVTHNGGTYYLSYSGSRVRTGVQTRQGGRGQQAQYSYITDSQGNTFENTASTGGGTYIQGGLWGAMEIFNDVGDTTGQTPVIVLMSDGAPTYNTAQYDNVPNDAEYGAGNSSFAGDGFMTQLTAAYVKEQITAKYSSDGDGVGNKTYLYTVGFGVNNVTDSDVAKAVVDPSGSPHTDITNLWNTYNGSGNTMVVGMGMDGGNRGDYTTNVTITRDASLKNKQAYVDRYFAASQTADLNSAFQDVVNEIGIQAGYYPTRLDDNGSNYSGYITFVDHIGAGMEVKDIKGIMLENVLYTGQHLAQIMWQTEQNNKYGTSYEKVLGTKTEPTALGDELVRAVKERFGITADTNEEANNIAWALIGNAWSTGQLSYDPDTKAFSNYIGWYGDAAGNYLGYDSNAAASATYYNECYGMLGQDDDYNTMHIAIQVSTHLTTGEQIVTFRIPASLLPVVSYQISVDGNEITDSSKVTLTYDAAQPIRLVYEVGVSEDVNELNISQYGKLAADGKYYLYTNAWDIISGSALDKNPANNNYTYSYFEPSVENEHYYFTENSPILDASHNPVAAIEAGKSYYFAHRIFSTATSGAKDAATVSYHYEELSAAALAVAQADENGNLYVPKGTMHRNMHSHDLKKTANATESYEQVRKQFVDATVTRDSSHHYELTYLGNNGRLTVASAQGIKLTKKMVSGVSADGVEFTFTIGLTAPAGQTLATSYPAIYEDANGKQTQGTVSVTNGQIQVSLEAGQSVYITDLPTGTAYTVTESEMDGYKLSNSANATGAVQEYVLSTVTFTNDAWDLSTLTVSKTVTYLKGSAAVAGKLASFPVTVTLTRPNGQSYAGKVVNIGTKEYTTDANGRITFDITDGQRVTITNIPVGTTYVVEETTTGLPEGYTAIDAVENGTVTEAGAGAVLRNQYEPKDVEVLENEPPKVTVNGSKVVTNAAGQVIDWLADFEFTFTLYRYDASANGGQGGYVAVGAAQTVKAADAAKTFTFNLAGQKFDAVGTYSFYVEETIGIRPGMTYDRTFHEFQIVVTDADLDGQLEISDVKSVQHVSVSGDAENGWEVTTEYTNIYQVHSTKLALVAEKILEGRDLINGEFGFILSGAGFSDTEYNDEEGNVAFEAITFTAEGFYTFTLKEIIPDGAVNNVYEGVTYSDKTYDIEVDVKAGDGGQLYVANVYVNGERIIDLSALTNGYITFNNTYEAAPVTADPIVGNKTFLNITPGAGNAAIALNGNEFSFTLTGENVNETVFNKAGGTISFTAIEYTAAGTYVYEIVENATTKGGVTVDQAKYTVTVVVEDDGKGKLYVESTTYVKDGTIAASAAGFTNTYKAEPTGEVVISGNKVFYNATKKLNETLKGGEFSFQLKQGSSVIETVSNAADGSFSFRGLSFDAAGTYTYNVSEIAGDKTYISYSDKTATITIEVEDNGKGQLIAKVNNVEVTSVDVGEFRNVYTASDAKVQLIGHKHMSGRPMQSDDVFEFTLSGHGVSYTEKNDAHGIITFPELTFSAEGTYTYTIEEITAGSNGVTKDPTVHTVTIQVTDNGLGQLIATVNDADAEDYVAEFVNKYEADDVTVAISGGKTYHNGILNDNLFSFVIEAVTEDAPMPAAATVKNAGDDFAFGGITFTQTGVYEYTVREVIPADAVGGMKNGVYYDETVYHITIEVTDNLKGSLVAKAYIDGKEVALNNGLLSGVDFVNEYHASGTSVTITANKIFNHYQNEKLKGEDFSFRLTGSTGAPMPVHAVNGSITVTNAADGTITFPAIPFEAAGSYTYTITEVDGGKYGMSYDLAGRVVKIDVEDDGAGNLVAKVNGVSVTTVNAGTFTNSYDPDDAKVNLVGSKSYNKTLSGGEFSFRLEALDGGYLPAGAQNNAITVSNAAGGAFSFPELVFSKEGTFHYDITEINEGKGGVSYDGRIYHVRVEVQDVDGKLQATVTVNGHAYTDDLVVFTNTYTAKSVDVVLSGSKVLQNVTPGIAAGTYITLQGGEFSFNITGSNNVNEDVTNKADGSVTFSKLTFTEEGTYTYTITEADPTVPGVLDNNTIHTVTIEVSDDGNGQLVATINGGAAADFSFRFVNEYKATGGKLALTGVKSYTNTTPGAGNAAITLQGGEFQFTLTGLNGAPMPADAVNNAQTVSNGAGGVINFSEIAYDTVGTYTYTVEEVRKADGTDGIIYDKNVYTVTVTVTDEGDGTLKAVASSTGADVTFYNKYLAAPASVTLSGSKVYENVTPGIAAGTYIALQGGEFQFTLTGLNGAPMPAGAQNNALTVSNGAGGTISFDKLVFDEEGTYKYTISEVKGSKVYISYQATPVDITVVVTDNGYGQLVASVNGSDTANFTFQMNNTYKAGETKLALSGVKNYTNTTPGAGNAAIALMGGEFQFTLTGQNGAPMPAGAQNNAITVSNGAGGVINFSDIIFDTVGTYTYIMEEVKKADGTDGITYDKQIYTITVTVTDEGDGTLKAVASSSGNSVAFYNKYLAKRAEVNLVGTKVLLNVTPGVAAGTTIELSGNEFLFTLVDAEGNPKETVANGAGGSISFDTLTFEQEGTYIYTIFENDTTKTGVTKDPTVHTLTIEVKDKGYGQLVATINSESAADFTFGFVNTYLQETEDVPKNGDASFGIAMSMGLSAICMLAVLLLSKKKEELI